MMTLAKVARLCFSNFFYPRLNNSVLFYCITLLHHCTNGLVFKIEYQ